MPSDTETIWYISLLSNSAAVALTALVGYLFTHSVFYTRGEQLALEYDEDNSALKDSPKSTQKVSWRNFVFTLLASFATACVVYYIIFTVSGYVPMGRIK